MTGTFTLNNRSLLGLAGFYRRFIKNFSIIAKSLTILTQKCKTFDWGEEQLTFQTLKDKLCNAPVLALPDGLEDFVVYCDAFRIGLGCVLMQRDPSKIEAVKNWKAPRTPSKKCKTFDWGEKQELAFQTLKDKLCNAPVLAHPDGLKDFVVYCDAFGIGLGYVLMQRVMVRAYASSQKELNMRHRRWIELLSNYDCEIGYHPGKANVVADALCRKERVKPKRVRAINMTL
nr:hypothetical protein [Tanacetum cinerariifolium]